MQMSDYEQRGTGSCLYLKRWCKTHHLFLLILHYAVLCFFELSRKFFQISRYVNLLWADLLTGTACDAVPRLFALLHTADCHARIPCQAFRVKCNLIILIQYLRNINAFRAVGRAVTAGGTRYAACHFFRFFIKHFFFIFAHRLACFKNLDIFFKLLQIRHA